ncbi:baseplate protein [Pseudanabaena phage Pam4]|nr:baseplate protein [Pseudanabaena phage Pam4]
MAAVRWQDDPVTVCADPTVTVALTWGTAPEDTLLIPADCDGEGMWWNALTLPDWSTRTAIAPPSAWVPGAVMLSSVTDAASLPMIVAVRGDTLAGLLALQEDLRAALDHYPLTVTITADTTPLGSWAAMPTVPQWLSAVSPRSVSMLTVEASFTLTVNPAGA